MSGKIKIDTKATVTERMPCTPEHQLWAAAHLADLPLRILFHGDKRYKTKMFMTPGDDTVFRRAFHILAIPGDAIIIRVYRRATEYDLTRALKIAEAARAGDIPSHMWTERREGGMKMVAFLPHNPARYSPEVRPCDNTMCREQWHTWETRDVPHPEAPCVHDEINADEYRVILQQHQGDKWEAFSSQMDVDDFTGPRGAEILRRWLNDHVYLQGEADRLNASTPAL